ncbi:hypothetical protein ACIA78_21850 [Streptomyces xanthochromogenes]|uniref:hypothetical protein n=2 Tax=Streptomyces xanthochromogenes TaxID=67384 RepID=UPI0037B4BD24
MTGKIEFLIPKDRLGDPEVAVSCQPMDGSSDPDAEYANTQFLYALRLNSMVVTRGDDLLSFETPRSPRFMAARLAEALAQQMEELAPPVEQTELWALLYDEVDRLTYWASGIVDPTVDGDEEPPCTHLGCKRHSRYAVHAVTLPKGVGAPEHDALLCVEHLEELRGRMDMMITKQERVL